MTILEATSPRTNPLADVLGLGQSIWYDNIHRRLIDSGELRRMVEEDGLRGVTSNPAIFEKAIAGSDDYAAAIAELRARGETDPKAIYEALAVRDVQDAADVLRPVYDESRRRDGHVSLEVSPTLAHDAAGTIAEAERLWAAVDRENLMIKVPATPAGIEAIRWLVARGINVNVTLLFSTRVYEQVAEAYMAGIEELVRRGGNPARVASVASFFVSRIDSSVDAVFAERTGDSLAQALRGKVAVANAKVTYARAQELYASRRWARLAAHGAQQQRLLWASTGTKDPAYSDVLYVEELVGRDTVNTVPPATYDAFRDHGSVRLSLEEDVDDARTTIGLLRYASIDFQQVTDELLANGLLAFAGAFEALLAAVAATTPALEREVSATIADWESGDKMRRLWARDASLWTGADEASWLGWLTIADEQAARVDELRALAEDVRSAGFRHVVLLGMGGSSLAPELLARTFGAQPGFPELRILDSTDPAQLLDVERSVDLERTLFVVSSKSGSTLEPNIFMDYFFERVVEAVGRDEAGSRFVAVTDPGSQVEQVARERGFRHVAHGVPSIGGRYSALSDFGLVPAALMGLDVEALLDRARAMAEASKAETDNPGLALGAAIGTAAKAGRDKLTLVVSPAIVDLGAWLEQLVAESTGKLGVGVVPVDREPLAEPDKYGDDRLFAYVRLGSAPDAGQDAAVEALRRAGHPVVTLRVGETGDLLAELFRWEIATAVAGAVIGINPFDQPDVEDAKIATRALMAEVERTGALPAEDRPLHVGDPGFVDALHRHLATVGEGDYVALLAYIAREEGHERALTEIRTEIRDRTKAATAVGFGPRFLHSTGQAYKGGPNSGVFLQLTSDDDVDVEVPGRGYTFGVVKAAQARGDLDVLDARGRRTLRIHLGSDVAAGLDTLRAAVRVALSS